MYLVPLLQLFGECEPEDVIDLLPDELRAIFDAWLREAYDNAVPASEFSIFDSAAGSESAESLVVAARRYFAKAQA